MGNSIDQGGKTVTDDGYLGRLGLQLIDAPATSRQLLDAAAKGSLPPADKGAAYAIVSAQSWVKAVLRDRYSYPDGTPFLSFRQENGAFDVVRARYVAGGLNIEIAQSLHVISVTIRGFASRQPLASRTRAEEVARAVLNMKSPLRFEESGSFEKGVGGKQATAPGTPGWPFWEDELRWWCDADAVGFVTLKAAGGPTQALISPTEGLNLHWFE